MLTPFRGNGFKDAQEWLNQTPPDAVAMVRGVIAQEPTPKALRRALYRLPANSDDGLTDRIARSCRAHDYASYFGWVVLRAD